MPRILVVDDYEPILFAMQVVLESAGHRVLTSTSGLGVADRVRTESPDILITDLFMPGQDGLELIAEIRSFDSKLLIVAVCGEEKWSTEALFVAKSLGADEVMCKPFNKGELLGVIEGLLSKRVAQKAA